MAEDWDNQADAFLLGTAANLLADDSFPNEAWVIVEAVLNTECMDEKNFSCLLEDVLSWSNEDIQGACRMVRRGETPCEDPFMRWECTDIPPEQVLMDCRRGVRRVAVQGPCRLAPSCRTGDASDGSAPCF